MAPPVFSYFRGHHRRTGSSPSSPQASQVSPTFQQPPQWSAPHESPYGQPAWSHSYSNHSPISPLPPVLPPIPRIASQKVVVVDREEIQPPTLTDDASTHSKASPANSTRWRPHRFDRRSPSLPSISSLQQDNRPLSYNDVSGLSDKPPSSSSSSADHKSWVPDFRPTVTLEPFVPAGRSPSGLRNNSDADSQESRPARMASTSSSVVLSARPPTPKEGGGVLLKPSHQHLRSTSPTASFFSYQKAASSTNLASDPSHSPGASHPVPQPQPLKISTRSKINLLNPVSLLMRRRASQVTDGGDESALYGHRNLDVPAMSLPDDYDPRIKGKGVHDFSAPRPPRRVPPISDVESQVATSVSNSTIQESAEPVTGDAKAQSPDKEHKPAFVENFDDTEEENSSSGVQREALANPAFLARMSKQNMFVDDIDFAVSNVPASQESTSTLTKAAPEQERPVTPQHRQQGSKGTVASSFRDSVDNSTTARTSIDTRSTTPPRTPPSERRSRSSLSLDEVQAPTTAKKLRSSASQASRFSFQLQGERSLAQERALEEKGKAKQDDIAKRASMADSRFEDVMDNDDYDMDDDDDGVPYEEEIPGVNADDESDFPVGGLHDQRLSTEMNRLSLDTETPKKKPVLDIDTKVASRNSLEGIYSNSGQESIQQSPPTIKAQRTSAKELDLNDDMYFDDGLIDNLDDGYEAVTDDYDTTFDEDLLDSPSDGTFQERRLDQAVKPITSDNPGPYTHKSKSSLDAAPFQNGHDVTSQSGLDAYHRALASAANNAAASGKFQRSMSIDGPGNQFLLQNTLGNLMQPNPYDEDVNGLQGYEDDDPDMGEDDMIEAANADAIAADNSGFYGREFGIGIDRHISGRNVSREPNLTPITERSEFSTRNSFISVAGNTYPGFPPGTSLPRDGAGPGLKDLMAADHEDEMTLSQLMRLRKDAFSGNAGSARNSWSGSNAGGGGGGSTSSSPVNYTSHASFAARCGSSLSEAAELTSPEQFAGRVSPAAQQHGRQSPASYSPQPQFHAHSRSDSHGGLVNFASNSNIPRPSDPAYMFAPEAVQSYVSRPGLVQPVSQMVGSPPAQFQMPAPQQIQPPQQDPTKKSEPRGIPSPAEDMMHRFAGRPPTDAYRKSHQPSAFASGAPATPREQVTTNYVQDIDPATGRLTWYMEKWKKLDGGEELVGRAVVEGGRI